MEQLYQLFRERPEAWTYIQLYLEYVHEIDDLVDEKFEVEKFLHCLYLASLLYSSDYFTRNRAQLLPVEHSIINTYADSVKWETSSDEDKKRWADTLRHCGLDTVLKIIQIEFGWDALRKCSEIVRELVFKR